MANMPTPAGRANSHNSLPTGLLANADCLLLFTSSYYHNISCIYNYLSHLGKLSSLHLHKTLESATAPLAERLLGNNNHRRMYHTDLFVR